ncbi:MAG: tRNA (adenosine(37)-N6)-threonylcarbamoyltransferase complex ATPase subunit type 1 TsaE [Planctomyces sp.]|nr:tRNA (adenosine(37)-N6)-threonylcarbamoyltransferase complex ATPase subunit type 1 TsaE [Planctomyces sp.]
MRPLSSTVVEFLSGSEAETDRFAAALAPLLRPGDVVALDGDLGAGKTRLVRALAAALGCDAAQVSSPTFGLVQHYAGPLPLVHIDAYRLRDCDEFEELGGRELFEADAVTLIEWADRIAPSLPTKRWTIAAEHVGPTSRRYRVACPPDERAARLLAAAAGGA